MEDASYFQLHPQDAKISLLDWCIEGCTNTETQDQPGVHRINNAIIPQPDKRTKHESLGIYHQTTIYTLPAQKCQESFSSGNVWTYWLDSVYSNLTAETMFKREGNDEKWNDFHPRPHRMSNWAYGFRNSLLQETTKIIPGLKTFLLISGKNFPVPLQPTQTYKSSWHIPVITMKSHINLGNSL